MAYIGLCIAVFVVTYLINCTMVAVFYHRGFSHGAVKLSRPAMWVTQHLGIWLTGLDPVGWACMHRRHHAFSDTPEDPHSPVHAGFFGVFSAQLKSYERCLVGLATGRKSYTRYVKDLPFGVNILNRKKLWILPYVLHFGIALAIALPTGMWALGAAYILGMLTHPIEGWVINSFGHAVGKRNFDTNDNSRNSHIAAWLVFGEGYQNNHHAFPASAKFSYRPVEVDMGYAICLVLEALGVLKIQRDSLIKSVIQRREQGTPMPVMLKKAA